ncbi:MAG TPA: alkyl hydroperoxide reductase [Micromonosporaceae bacterium]|nr:alkyl hydroperoxide reductase [Micromonosporaceae bacterium]HCU49463.1 alkyl hydroperoxide reductase [Micromonosporaceae bacterium]
MMVRMTRLLSLGLATVIALSGCTGGSQRDAGQVVKYAPGQRVEAPEVKGELLEGGSYDLAAMKGKVVVVNFWASWCAPCRVEADDLEAVRKAMPGVEFVGINIRDEKDKALAFHDGRAGYPSIFDPAGKLALAFKEVPPNTIPATLIIDSQGRIAVVVRKSIQEQELLQLTTDVAAEGKS